MELWVKIKTNRHDYDISNFGRVRRIMSSGEHKLMKLTPFQNKEYLSVSLPIDEKNPNNQLCGYKRKRVHVLVALAFIPNPQNKPTVNHKDGNKQNNHVNNLEWATNQEQTDHSIMIGINSTLDKRKLTKRQVMVILNSKNTDLALAKKYMVRPSVIYNVRTRASYTHWYDEFIKEHGKVKYDYTPKRYLTQNQVESLIKEYNEILTTKERIRNGNKEKAYGMVNELFKKYSLSETNARRIINRELKYLKDIET